MPTPSSFRRSWRLGGSSLFCLVSLVACKGDEPRGAPPPPAPKPAACSGGGGAIRDGASAAFFPRTSGGFCLDPNGGEKTFGDGATLPLDQICDLFDGECEVYKGFNVRRVVEARYIDGAGSPATIDVHLSKFATAEGAYAMFTKRVVGDGDPADEAVPRPTEGGGAAALGLGNAYIWRSLYLAEITYNDESASEPVMKAKGESLLPPLVREMGSKLPGDVQLPAAAAALPKENRLPMGIRYVTTDLLGIDGIGGGAVGYYRDGAKRYRLISIVRGEIDQAKDVLATLGKLQGAAREKGIGEGAVRVMRKDGDDAAVEWIFARSGKTVVGIGDEVRALGAGATAEEHAKVSLDRDKKSERLKSALPPP